MRSCSGQRQDKDIIFDTVDQQPVRENMAFPVSHPIAGQRMILVLFRKRFPHGKQGDDILTACQKGASERFRAVLMTALTFILGVFPMVIATGAGAASQRAIGTTVFFGMIGATLVGILFIPALFALFDTFISKKGNAK